MGVLGSRRLITSAQKWWSAPVNLLDGARPALAADFSRQRYMLGGVSVPLSSILTLSSGPKWVIAANNLYSLVSANTPAFDYSTGRGRLRLEGASTNLFLNSATGATQSIATAAGSYTLSFYGTGSITLTGTASGTLNGTGGGNRVALTVTATAGTATLTVTGSISNVQFEAQGFASSYIPTAGSAVTRAVDIATLTAAALAAFQGASFTVAVRGQVQDASTTNNRILASPSGAIIRRNGLSGGVDTGTSAGVYTSPAPPGSGSLNTGFGAVLAAGAASRSIVANGGTVASDGNGVAAYGLSAASLGSQNGGIAASGWYDELIVWPIQGSAAAIKGQARVWQ